MKLSKQTKLILFMVFGLIYINPINAMAAKKIENISASLSIFEDTNGTYDFRPVLEQYPNIRRVEIAAAPKNGVASYNSGIVTYTPYPNYFGSDELTIIGFNRRGRAIYTIVTSIQILAVNDAPVLSELPAYSINEESELVVEIQVTDPDDEEISINITQVPENGSVLINGKTLQYNPNVNWFGTETIKFQANDGEASSNESSLSVNVLDVRDTPTGLSEASIINLDITDPSVTLTNAHGVSIDDQNLSMWSYKEGNKLFIGSSQSGTYQSSYEVNAQIANYTIEALAGELWLQYKDISDNKMKMIKSADSGKNWSTAVEIGQVDAGTPISSFCVWKDGEQTKALSAFISSTSNDNPGALYVNYYDGQNWGTANQLGEVDLYTAPSLDCDSTNQILVVRKDPTTAGGGISIEMFKYDQPTRQWSGQEIINRGADPSFCLNGNNLYVGYHVNGNAMLGHSPDLGATWSAKTLDETGKFVSVDCDSNGTIGVLWGDWDTKEEANQKASNRRLTGLVSFDNGDNWSDLKPVNDEAGQGPANIRIGENGIAVLWKGVNQIRHAHYDYIRP